MVGPAGVAPFESALDKAMNETVFPMDTDLEPQVPPFKFLVPEGDGFVPDPSKLPDGWKFPGA
jgi:hypothetical protein